MNEYLPFACHHCGQQVRADGSCNCEPAPEVELCGQMGDGLHEYGRCKLPLGHGRGPDDGDDSDIHEDEEGFTWRW